MSDNKYAAYVEHSRYGKGPIYTGIDPDRNDPDVHLHWRMGIWSDLVRSEMKRTFGKVLPLPRGSFGAILGTAVSADLSKQTQATIPVTHYYDEDRVCRNCGHRFIFFALEQKYWYEELQFPLEADCVCCSKCRKANQSIARQRKRYEELCRITNRSVDEMFEMANCCLTLIEEGLFGDRQTEHVRAIINQLPADQRVGQNFQELLTRLHNVENKIADK